MWNLVKHSPHSVLDDESVDLTKDDFTLQGIISLGIDPKIRDAK